MISRTLRALAALCALGLTATGCGNDTKYNLPHRVDSFKVTIEEVRPTFPPNQTGESPDKALPIPIDPVLFKVRVVAVDERGEVMSDYSRPVSFRATPGNVLATALEDGKPWADRLLPFNDGVATGWVTVDKIFGEFRIWAEDAPPPPIYELELPGEGGADGGVPGPDAGEQEPLYVEVEGSRTFAGGVSNPIYFVAPAIRDVQRVPTDPPGCQDAYCRVDNRLSPFIGNFLTIDAPRPLGDMIVTSITNEGFYVTDLLAQRFDREPYKSAVGTLGHLFVYSYSYPDGLYVGDRVTSLTGTVQEFSGATQLVFPSWVRLEGDPRPEDIPAPFVLDFSDPITPSVGYTVCKTGTRYDPKPNRMENLDLLCGYSTNNVHIESLESSLVKIANARPSTAFVNCDRNGNANIGLFGQTKDEETDLWHWLCFEEGEDKDDCQCYLECVIGHGEFDGKVCTELNSFETYGQWLVQLEDRWSVRLNVSTRDALPLFDPRDFAKPEHAGCTVDIAGIMRQTQAARPRWIVIAREETDVCCRAPEGKTCPTGIPVCGQ